MQGYSGGGGLMLLFGASALALLITVVGLTWAFAHFVF